MDCKVIYGFYLLLSKTFHCLLFLLSESTDELEWTLALVWSFLWKCFGKEYLRGGKEGGLRRCIYGEQKYAFSVKILMSFEPHWICNKCLTTIVLLYQSRYNALSNSILSNNTLVCFNPDMMLYVFLSMYCTDTTRSRTQFSTNNTSVCINPNMMLYVFFSMYRSDTTRSLTLCSKQEK